jgi:hypothetical protein
MYSQFGHKVFKSFKLNQKTVFSVYAGSGRQTNNKNEGFKAASHDSTLSRKS